MLFNFSDTKIWISLGVALNLFTWGAFFIGTGAGIGTRTEAVLGGGRSGTTSVFLLWTYHFRRGLISTQFAIGSVLQQIDRKSLSLFRMIFISFISYNLSMVTQPLNNAKTKPRQPLSSAFLFIMTALLIRPHTMQKVKVKALESLFGLYEGKQMQIAEQGIFNSPSPFETWSFVLLAPQKPCPRPWLQYRDAQ